MRLQLQLLRPRASSWVGQDRQKRTRRGVRRMPMGASAAMHLGLRGHHQ